MKHTVIGLWGSALLVDERGRLMDELGLLLRAESLVHPVAKVVVFWDRQLLGLFYCIASYKRHSEKYSRLLG